jgi:hypothetical protein
MFQKAATQNSQYYVELILVGDNANLAVDHTAQFAHLIADSVM